MGNDEVGTLKGLTERRSILDRLIGEHGGRIANTAGDSVLAEFSSAVEAVQCAVEAQTALAEVNTGVPLDNPINFRIGVHIGDVMVRAADLFGDGVNIAARLQSIAKPGGVCISGVTYDQVRNVLPMAPASCSTAIAQPRSVRIHSLKIAASIRCLATALPLRSADSHQSPHRRIGNEAGRTVRHRHQIVVHDAQIEALQIRDVAGNVHRQELAPPIGVFFAR